MNRRQFFQLTAGMAVSAEILPAAAVISPKKQMIEWFLRWMAEFRTFIGDVPTLRKEIWPVIDEIMAREGQRVGLTDLIYGKNLSPQVQTPHSSA